MNASRGERGIALIGALTAIAVLLPVVSRLHASMVTEAIVARRSSVHLQALYSAEAGLALARAQLASGVNADDLLLGADGEEGTEDDGMVPFAGGGPLHYPSADYSVEVRVAPGPAGYLRLVARATGPGGIAREVRAIVRLPIAGGGSAWAILRYEDP